MGFVARLLLAGALAAPGVAPQVQLNQVAGSDLRVAQAEVGSAQASFDAASRAAAASSAAASAAAQVAAQAHAVLAGLGAADRAQAAAISAARARVRAFALEAYVDGGAGAQLAAMFGGESVSDLGRRRVLLQAVADEGAASVRALETARAKAARGAADVERQVRRADDAAAAAGRAADAARFAVSAASAVLADRRNVLHLVEAALPVPGTDIPAMAFDAYHRAAATVAGQGCALPWWAVAAVGKVESNHGRSHDARLDLAGGLSPPILGPALDGTNGTQPVPATDGGRFTGDPTWSHAVGPMQFIPSTWARWARDGNGDGTSDPNNIYDAALATAAYLCATSPDVHSDAGLAAGYFSYNHSDDYVAAVQAAAHGYAGVGPGP